MVNRGTKRGLVAAAMVGAAGLVVACSGAQVEEKTSNDKAGWTVDLDWHPHDDDAPPAGDPYAGGGAPANCWSIGANAVNMTKSQASSALDMLLANQCRYPNTYSGVVKQFYCPDPDPSVPSCTTRADARCCAPPSGGGGSNSSTGGSGTPPSCYSDFDCVQQYGSTASCVLGICLWGT